MKFDMCVCVSKNLSRKFKFHQNVTRTTGTLGEDVCKFVISFSILVTMRNFSEKKDVEKIKTHVIFNNIFSDNCALYEIIWKNVVQPNRQQATIYYGAYTLNAGYLRLQTHIQNM
jgi:hypothetical protein